MMLAVHQPNFCPWMPFFEKMRQADVFVLLTYCQYARRGRQNRFDYAGKWYTMSVCGGHVADRVRDKRYANVSQDWARIAAAFPQMAQRLDVSPREELWKFNSDIVISARRQLGIETPVVLDEPTELTSTDRLSALCRKMGCDEYLSGAGARDYLDIPKMEQDGIRVRWLKYDDCRPLVEALQ
jgi:hypothetical protein